MRIVFGFCGLASFIAACAVGPSAFGAPPIRSAALRDSGSSSAASHYQGISEPVVGYLQSGPTALRAILGVAGASHLGEPLATPAGTLELSLAPGQDYALLVSEGHPSLAVATINGISLGEPTELSGSVSGALIHFSPTGRSAAFVASQHVQVWTGFPEAPRLSFELELTAGASHVAVNDAGTLVLFQEEGGSVLLATGSAAPELVWSGAGTVSMAFLPEKNAAAVCGTSSRQLAFLQGLGADFSTRVLAEDLDISEGALLSTSRNGSHIVLAGVGEHRVARIAVDSTSVEWIRSSAPITTLSGLKSGGQFLVSAEEGNAAWVLDTSDLQARIYFVPRVGTAAAEGEAK